MSDTLRVTVNEDGTIDLLDFGVPPEYARPDRIRKGLKQEEVAPWIMETISMLRIAAARDNVLGLGFRVSDTVYYIQDRSGEGNE